MPDQLQLRGGTTAQNDAFTGAAREVTVDTTKDTLVVHDASTAGGNPLMREDGANSELVLGSAATPSLKFTGDANTGIFSPGADQVAVSTGGTERVEWGTSEVVFNDGGENYDFRIEGDTNANLLFVDASTDRIGVGTSSPAEKLEISETAAGDSVTLKIANTGDSNVNTQCSILAQQGVRQGGTIIFGRENAGSWNSSAALANGWISFNPVRSASNVEAARFDSQGRLLVGTTSSSAVCTQVLQGNSTDSASGARLVLARGTTSISDGINLGDLTFSDSGHVDAGSIKAQRDGGTWTSGSSQPTRLVFSTTADGASSPTERMRIAQNGRINMYDVYGTAIGGTTRDLYIESTGQLGYLTSTAKTKTNIQDVADVSWLYSLNVKSFNYKLRDEKGDLTEQANPEIEYGLIAEEVEEIAPELCFYNETPNGLELEGVTYRKLVAPMLKALQQSQVRIEQLEAKVAALESA